MRVVRWVLLFGGIALFAVVFYALLGIWLWRRATALLHELVAAGDKLEAASAVLDDVDRAPATTGQHARRPTPAEAGQRP